MPQTGPRGAAGGGAGAPASSRSSRTDAGSSPTPSPPGLRDDRQARQRAGRVARHRRVLNPAAPAKTEAPGWSSSRTWMTHERGEGLGARDLARGVRDRGAARTRRATRPRWRPRGCAGAAAGRVDGAAPRPGPRGGWGARGHNLRDFVVRGLPGRAAVPDRAHVPFADKDVERDADAAREPEAKAGRLGIPTDPCRSSMFGGGCCLGSTRRALNRCWGSARDWPGASARRGGGGGGSRRAGGGRGTSD